ncbi:MAG TPA: right-handed parallel beta-helix repeat-containing protein, partial [Thermoanaerobaculia bacterium]|nr:right-handed parallel beta-helix repeat-containing protein [Thermoanaerobaculia bacterium]
MRRLFLLLVLVTSPLFAQSADLSVSIENTSEAGRPDQTYIVRTHWSGDTPVQNAVLEIDIPGASIGNASGPDGFWTCDRQARPVRCTGRSALASVDGYLAVFAFFDKGGTYTATARLTSDTPDPNLDNNVATLTTTLTGRPGLSVTTMLDFDSKPAFDPGEELTLRLGVQNYGFTATGVTMTARLPDGGTFTKAEFESGSGTQPTCTVTPQLVACYFERLTPNEYGVVDLTVIAPQRTEGGTFPVESYVTSAEEPTPSTPHRLDVVLRRQLPVTSDADDGSGSLRQVLRDAAAECVTAPCTINVEVPLIQPRTPLPDVRGNVKIDGGAAKAILDGALLNEGDALRYRAGCDFIARRLVIRNFPGHAIDIRPTAGAAPCQQLLTVTIRIEQNELTGNLRGVAIDGFNTEIVNNLIRDHRRAGIFSEHAMYTLISSNTITGNGAAGVYIDPSNGQSGVPAGADVKNNIIRDNGEFGVARTEHGIVQITANEIAGNRWYGIDLNLDLDTPNRPDAGNGVPNKPVLIDAIYDAASNTTRVRGTLDVLSGSLDFYASHSLSTAGYPEAEHQVLANAFTGGKTDFEISLPGDLRGQWITATATRGATIYFAKPARRMAADDLRPFGGGNTSELSNA